MSSQYLNNSNNEAQHCVQIMVDPVSEPSDIEDIVNMILSLCRSKTDYYSVKVVYLIPNRPLSADKFDELERDILSFQERLRFCLNLENLSLKRFEISVFSPIKHNVRMYKIGKKLNIENVKR